MKKNGNHGVIAQIAGSGLVLAALLVLVLFSPGNGWAQSNPVSTEKPFAEQTTAKASASPAASPRARGEHEGIKVHGHWTIEVKNPDGKLVTHTEFENSLTTANAYSGSALLTNALGRTTTIGGWEILLVTNGGSMHIDEPGSTLATICNYLACSPNLSVIAGTTQSPGTLTVTGFVTVPASQTSITQVQTNVIGCPSTVLPSACFNVPTTGTWNTYGFTQANPSPAIAISPGQVVQATVNISFQ